MARLGLGLDIYGLGGVIRQTLATLTFLRITLEGSGSCFSRVGSISRVQFAYSASSSRRHATDKIMLDGEPSKHAHVCTPWASPRLLNPEPRKGVTGLMA